MIELSKDDLLLVSGAGDNNCPPAPWNPTGLISGLVTTAMRVPVPAAMAIGVATEVMIMAEPHMPVNVPMPQVPMNPSWVGNPPPRPHFLPGNY